MSDSPPNPKKRQTAAERREKQLAAALRANLKRRKAAGSPKAEEKDTET